ncbi:single-stranded-DNA-specific exonuclease RecJ [Thalassotalea mangrovi]|uniref:Single-stranded-DNA-specific exonuclease RecJ n=1 Tax=Thalassotalea mangrovi TaxID=2572245 RepID=A0A4U1BAH2_9GAMM|nr:single-stranded-DNA-specific exonuclease RecJ [Thalassotalea mangrovi]TKB47415.1 single-stranded-DNA-specific exonuclease RecJ [Thalassotalea mangrovi]
MSKTIRRRSPSDCEALNMPLDPLLKLLYANRGIRAPGELDTELKALHSPALMKDLRKAADILFAAIGQGKRIIVVGDFDADGATSTALMMQGLALLGSDNHDFLVPNRFEYGYGLTPEIADLAIAKGAELLITVDNGISCIAGVARAKASGASVIVTDHHLPAEQLPDADAIVNPNQVDCQFPSKAIAGVGVAFYLLLALRQVMREQHWFQQRGLAEANLAQLLDLVALGTVADVVSLDQNNRVLVAQGIKRIRSGYTRPGITALLEIAKKNPQRLRASDFGFALGPRLNAAGRLDDMALGIQCLLAPELNQARVIAMQLDHLNKARREIEQGMQQEAEQVLQKLDFNQQSLPNGIALYQQDWHQGVIGIVAGRIKEKYHRPTVVFAAGSEGELKGSARSIPGLHIRDLLEHLDSQNPGLIIKFGGHAMAAGLSLAESQFARFQQLFEQLAGQWLTREMLENSVLSDGPLTLSQMTEQQCELIENGGPWGQNFPEPVFDNQFELVQQRLLGEKHLKMVVRFEQQVFDAIAFNVDTSIWPNEQVDNVHLAYKLDINEFRGQRNLQLMVEHLEPL